MKELYTAKEVAEYLSLNKQTVNRFLREGRLEGFQILSEWRVKREALEAFIERERKANKVRRPPPPLAKHRHQIRQYSVRIINGKRHREPVSRWVWSDANGEIPKGMHIHHKDGDCSNDALENLECVTPKEHAQRHRQLRAEKNA